MEDFEEGALKGEANKSPLLIPIYISYCTSFKISATSTHILSINTFVICYKSFLGGRK
jgi:hypothetical protein